MTDAWSQAWNAGRLAWAWTWNVIAPWPIAAELGALAAEGLAGVARVDVEVELVVLVGHDVALEQELRDVEGVDDVLAEEVTWTGRRAGPSCVPKNT